MNTNNTTTLSLDDLVKSSRSKDNAKAIKARGSLLNLCWTAIESIPDQEVVQTNKRIRKSSSDGIPVLNLERGTMTDDQLVAAIAPLVTGQPAQPLAGPAPTTSVPTEPSMPSAVEVLSDTLRDVTGAHSSEEAIQAAIEFQRAVEKSSLSASQAGRVFNQIVEGDLPKLMNIERNGKITVGVDEKLEQRAAAADTKAVELQNELAAVKQELKDSISENSGLKDKVKEAEAAAKDKTDNSAELEAAKAEIKTVKTDLANCNTDLERMRARIIAVNKAPTDGGWKPEYEDNFFNFIGNLQARGSGFKLDSNAAGIPNGLREFAGDPKSGVPGPKAVATS